MPDLRIVTWNSTGENAPRQTELLNEINHLNATYQLTPVSVVLNQEAQQAAGDNIYNMLNNAAAPTPVGLGGGYTLPPAHTQEHLNGTGKGYNALFSTALTITYPFQLFNYSNDGLFNGWCNQQNLETKRIALQEAGNYRPPVSVRFNYAGSAVRLITWHAPLGRSGVMRGCTTYGGAPLDAFVFLEASGLLRANVGIDVIIIAGDLNMTETDLAAKCLGYEPLKNFYGEPSHLDHITAWHLNGGVVTFHEPRSVASAYSVHNIFSCRVSW